MSCLNFDLVPAAVSLHPVSYSLSCIKPSDLCPSPPVLRGVHSLRLSIVKTGLNGDEN